ncbi:unnamed protein product [Caenorhabditis auriculariae]|uniref:Sulfotransferase domain-containing protein n=1 Tax=Caenorhabditis auriculariae TaxID=2777116 RepID=A0A8S1HCY7_9PELO|nr:unnamed protein product [Caenorhabditis auriculariae]
MKREYFYGLLALFSIFFLFTIATRPFFYDDSTTTTTISGLRVEYRNNEAEMILAPEQFIPSGIDLKYSLLFHEKYNVAACSVEKNMSAVLFAIFCILFNPDAFRSLPVDKRNIHGGWFNIKSCQHDEDNFFQHYAHQETLIKVENFEKFVVVRDPLERFISGFVNQCFVNYHRGNKVVCYGCEGDLKCVLEWLMARLQAFSQSTIQRGSRDFYTEHLMPFTWHCEFAKRNEAFRRIQFNEENPSETVEEVLEILEKASVEPRILKLLRESTVGKMIIHTTGGSSDRDRFKNQLLRDPYLLYLFRRIFYRDYEHLGFKRIDFSTMRSIIIFTSLIILAQASPLFRYFDGADAMESSEFSEPISRPAIRRERYLVDTKAEDISLLESDEKEDRSRPEGHEEGERIIRDSAFLYKLAPRHIKILETLRKPIYLL